MTGIFARRRLSFALVSDPKAAARDTVERARDDLVGLSRRIHAEPEILWEEVRASAWTAEPVRVQNSGSSCRRR